MKAIPAALAGAALGAVLGAAATFAYLKANLAGADELDATRKQLSTAQADLVAANQSLSRKARRVEELEQLAQASENAAVAALDAGKTPDTDPTAKGKGEKDDNFMAEIMRDFGQNQSKLAFETLVGRFGLEGEELEAFKAVFEGMREKRQAAFSKFVTGGLTLEDLAMIDGYSPEVDEWVAANLDDAGKAEYASYKEEQELNRIERKANEELTRLSTVANLNAEQKDAAFEIFAEHQKTERPEDILEVNMENFETEWKSAMNSRAKALSEVLDERQMEAYQTQSETMAKMFEGILRSAIGNEE